MLAWVVLLLIADPQQTIPLLQRGLEALQHGQLAEARKDLEEASRGDPKNAYVWSSLAETYLRLKLPQQASAAARTAEETGSGNPLICHALALYYAAAGQPGRAAQFEEKFAASPNADGAALSRAAGLYLNAGDTQKGLVLAEEAASRHESADNDDLLGRALIAAGQVGEGEKRLESAWDQSQTDAQVAFDFAQVLLQQGNFTRAANIIDLALAAHPRNPQLTLALGVARYGQRRFEDSISAFLKVIDVDPAIEQPYVFLGRMLDQAGPHLADITKVDERWLARDPKSAKAHLLLAKAVLAADPRSTRAETLLRGSIMIDSKDWEAHYELGVLLESKHDYQAAAAELTRSIELDAKQPMPHYHLARVYDRLGEPEQARAERAIHQQLTGSRAP